MQKKKEENLQQKKSVYDKLNTETKQQSTKQQELKNKVHSKIKYRSKNTIHTHSSQRSILNQATTKEKHPNDHQDSNESI